MTGTIAEARALCDVGDNTRNNPREQSGTSNNNSPGGIGQKSGIVGDLLNGVNPTGSSILNSGNFGIRANAKGVAQFLAETHF